MIGWIVLVIAAIALAIWLSIEVRDEEKMSDPMTRTDTGYSSSRFETNAYNKIYASEIRVKKPKSKKTSKAKVIKKMIRLTP